MIFWPASRCFATFPRSYSQPDPRQPGARQDAGRGGGDGGGGPCPGVPHLQGPLRGLDLVLGHLGGGDVEIRHGGCQVKHDAGACEKHNCSHPPPLARSEQPGPLTPGTSGMDQSPLGSQPPPTPTRGAQDPRQRPPHCLAAPSRAGQC